MTSAPGRRSNQVRISERLELVFKGQVEGSKIPKDDADVVCASPLTTLAFQGRLGRSIDFGGSKMMTRDEARIRHDCLQHQPVI